MNPSPLQAAGYPTKVGQVLSSVHLAKASILAQNKDMPHETENIDITKGIWKSRYYDRDSKLEEIMITEEKGPIFYVRTKGHLRLYEDTEMKKVLISFRKGRIVYHKVYDSAQLAGVYTISKTVR